MAKFIDINGLKTVIAKVYTDIKSKADKSYVDQSITNLNIDQKANKDEIPEQPNFTYKINIVASNQQPSVITTGTYPNLIITFNIPQGTGESSGGSDKPVDTGVPRMWYGWIPFDQESYDIEEGGGTVETKTGFTTEEEIGAGMTKTVIQYGLNNGSLTETDPKGFSSKIALGTVPTSAFICCIAPVASNVVSYFDNAGEKLHFGTLNPEVYCCPAEGLEITNPIDGVYYKIYGFMTSGGGLRYIWIEEQ